MYNVFIGVFNLNKKDQFWIILFPFILIVRQILEFYISVPLTGLFIADVSTFVHAILFYTFFFIFIALWVAHSTGWKKQDAIIKLIRISPLLFVAPFIDWIIFGRYGISMSYHFVGIKDFIGHIFSFFGPMTQGGITFGMRIQVLGILFLIGYWVYKQKKSIGETVLAVLGLYVIIYMLASTPSFFGWIQLIQTGEWRMSISGAVFSAINENVMRVFDWGEGGAISILRFNVLMAQTWFLTLIGIILWHIRSTLRTVYTMGRFMRAFLYIGFSGLGALLAPSYVLNVDININIATIISVLLAIIVIVSGWTYAFVINDVFDIVSDRLVHKDRPLPDQKITHAVMQKIAYGTGGIAIIGSFLLPWPSAFWIFALLACATLYSVPPFQLRRFFIVPQAIMAVASVNVFLFGHALVAKDALMWADMRILLALGIFLFGFWFLKDIADEVGDKEAGYKTVMTIYGHNMGPWMAYKICLITSIVALLFVFSILGAIILLLLHCFLYQCIKNGKVSEMMIPILLCGYMVAFLVGV